MSSLNRRFLRTIAMTLTAGCSLLFGSSIRADVIFIDDFDSQPAEAGDGTPVGYFSFGDQLSDRGVSNAFGATSGTNSAFYVINFSGNAADAFGVGAAHVGLSLSLDPNHFVSVQVRIPEGLVSGGFIGFRIADKDGTVVRTADTDLFAATGTFQPITQSLASLSHTDFTGATGGLDYSQIDSVGLLFFDRDFTGTTTVVFDDLRITAVPEPSSGLLIACAAAIVTAYRRQKNHESVALADLLEFLFFKNSNLQPLQILKPFLINLKSN